MVPRLQSRRRSAGRLQRRRRLPPVRAAAGGIGRSVRDRSTRVRVDVEPFPPAGALSRRAALGVPCSGSAAGSGPPTTGRTEREGPVFTSRFKSVAVTSDAQLSQVGSVHPPQSARDRPSATRCARIDGRASERSSEHEIVRRGCRPARVSDPERTASRPARLRTPAPAVRRRWADGAGVHVRRHRGRGRRSFVAIAWWHSPPCRGGSNELRTLVITLAVELRAASVLELADRYGVDPQSVRRTARRGRVAAATESDFARRRESASWLLTANSAWAAPDSVRVGTGPDEPGRTARFARDGSGMNRATRVGARDGDRDGRAGVARRVDPRDPGAGRGGRVTGDLPGDRARRRRRTESALRAQQARQGRRGGADLPPRRPARHGHRRPRSRPRSDSSSTTRPCTASSCSSHFPTVSIPSPSSI